MADYLVPVEHRDQSTQVAWLRMAVDTLQQVIQDVVCKPAGSINLYGRVVYFISEEQRAILIARHRTAMRFVSGYGQPAPRTTPLPREERPA